MLADGELDKALARFESSPPQDGLDRILYAYLLYKQERYGDARRYWLAALRDPDTTPFHASIYYYLARASYDDSAYGRAVTEMQNYRQIKTGSLSISRKDD